MKALALVFALVCSTAMADGITVISPSSPLSNATQARLRSERHDYTRAIPINLNRNGLGSNLLSVTLDGKSYTFVGGTRANADRANPNQSWYGVDRKNDASLSLTFNPQTNFMGGAVMIGATKRYEITTREGRDVLLEWDANFHAPKMKEGTQ